ncbi:MAG: hypothetical protein K2Y01_06170 [Rhabdochlamydiaceae bacterium]|nr:hypothetical protein [Rhabdochlamydiaceae bacterium]
MSYNVKCLFNAVPSIALFSPGTKSSTSTAASALPSSEILKKEIPAQKDKEKKVSVWNSRLIIAGAVGTMVVVGLYFWCRNKVAVVDSSSSTSSSKQVPINEQKAAGNVLNNIIKLSSVVSSEQGVNVEENGQNSLSASSSVTGSISELSIQVLGMCGLNSLNTSSTLPVEFNSTNASPVLLGSGSGAQEMIPLVESAGLEKAADPLARNVEEIGSAQRLVSQAAALVSKSEGSENRGQSSALRKAPLSALERKLKDAEAESSSLISKGAGIVSQRENGNT